MFITQGQFSFLPPLTDAQIVKQIQYALKNGWAVNVEFTASFHQLGTFLDRLERAEPFIRIERLQVAPPQSSKEAATIRAVFSTLYIPALTLDAVPTPGNGAHTERRHDQGIKG